MGYSFDLSTCLIRHETYNKKKALTNSLLRHTYVGHFGLLKCICNKEKREKKKRVKLLFI